MIHKATRVTLFSEIKQYMAALYMILSHYSECLKHYKRIKFLYDIKLRGMSQNFFLKWF